MFRYENDNDIGIAVIDAYTHYVLEYMEGINKTSHNTMADLFNTYDVKKINSHPGVRSDLFERRLDGALITDFLGGGGGGVARVEVSLPPPLPKEEVRLNFQAEGDIPVEGEGGGERDRHQRVHASALASQQQTSPDATGMGTTSDVIAARHPCVTIIGPTYKAETANPKMTPFPNELLLQLLSLLPLKSLIAARGVDCKWRQLIDAADILPLRRKLLDLYLSIINSPWFPQTRPWVLENLQPFDREAYISTLLMQYNRLPEAFMLWLLEWPALAVIGGIWPGLPLDHEEYKLTDEVEVFRGVNWLATRPVEVSAMTFNIPGFQRQYDFIPAILVRSHISNIWLVLDDAEIERESGTLKLRDRVFQLADRARHLYDETGNHGYGYDLVDNDWVEFQRRIWNKVESKARQSSFPPGAGDYYHNTKRDRIDAPCWSARFSCWIPECRATFF
ncbi:hypothetical protein D9615_008417 [Tricholomella constricta]|uniref:F-box domain-containing protein n=1 Tax=Tricholomella constricta TaxID=117010 RepID=A0A8H5HDM0_9AGAR|nr:hypothetical protein D9615_008417 [Tricholomella constricta]